VSSSCFLPGFVPTEKQQVSSLLLAEKIENLQSLCHTCNGRKKDHIEGTYGA
jgi:5-methylcytosine-specific restriction endonuclease McrA